MKTERLSNNGAWLAFAAFAGGGLALFGTGFYSCPGASSPFLGLAFGYFAYGIGFSVFMLALAYRGLNTLPRSLAAPANKVTDATVAVPAHNEEAVVCECVSSLLAQEPGVREIVVVNDGSTDATLERLRAAFALEAANPPATDDRPDGPSWTTVYRSRTHPCLRVVDQPQSGKASALNAALAMASGVVFVSADADTVFSRNAISRICSYLPPDGDVIAAGGVVCAANGVPTTTLLSGDPYLPRGLLPKLQWIEYALSFVWRFGWARINALLLLSGSFSAFRTSLLRTCGGFDPGSLTEDYEMAYRLHAYCTQRSLPYRMITVPDSLAFTLVPSTIRSLFQQRTRWFQGFMQTLLKHRRMLLDSRAGWLGIFVLPIKAVDAVAPLWGGYVYVGLIQRLHCQGFALDPAICLLLAVLALRFGVDIAIAWTQLGLRQRYIVPRLSRRQSLVLLLLAPLNIWFQRVLWVFYGLNAHRRLWLGKALWGKVRQAGFGESAN